MRVLLTDNFGRDYPIEKFVSESLSLKEAEALKDKMNLEADSYGPDYYIVVADIYEPKKGFEP